MRQTGPRAQKSGVTGDVTGLRRLLSRKVSIEAMIEIAMWVAIPYLLIGIAWTFFNADDVARIESQLETRIPAGSDLAAFGATTALWPFLLFGRRGLRGLTRKQAMMRSIHHCRRSGDALLGGGSVDWWWK